MSDDKRNREITLEDFQVGEEGAEVILSEISELGVELNHEDLVEDVGDLRVGIGGCWLNVDRTCDETCMAFNPEQAASGESPCQVIVGLRDIADPTMERRDLHLEELQKMRKQMEEFTRQLGTFIQTAQQALTRIR